VKLGEKDFNFYDKTIDKIESLEHIVNTILFNSHLCKNYYSEKVEIDNLFYQDLITSIRDAMYKWFVVGDSRAGYRALSKSFDRILINAITSEVIDNKNSSNPSKSINKIFNKTKNKLNLVYALRKYFEGDEFIMENNINSIREKLSEKIASKDISLVENDKEYYYAVGQISMYLIKLKSTNRICHSELNAILKCKTDVKLKEELIRTYKKYNFKIFTNYIKFQKLYSMVLGYNPTSKIDTQVLLFGALQDSILFNNEVDKNEEIKTIEESVN
jgi:CRISPR-associated protein Csh1